MEIRRLQVLIKIVILAESTESKNLFPRLTSHFNGRICQVLVLVVYEGDLVGFRVLILPHLVHNTIPQLPLRDVEPIHLDVLLDHPRVCRTIKQLTVIVRLPQISRVKIS